MWEMTYICGKWLKYLRNGKNMQEMMQICEKYKTSRQLADAA